MYHSSENKGFPCWLVPKYLAPYMCKSFLLACVGAVMVPVIPKDWPKVLLWPMLTVGERHYLVSYPLSLTFKIETCPL